MSNEERVVCNICNTSDREQRLYRVRCGGLVKCMRCGLYYANPRRTDSIQAVLNNATPTERYEAKLLNYRGRLSEFNLILSTIGKFKQPPARLLDIGCYEGYFLNEAQKRGWECYGVEPNIGAALYARDVLHLNVRQCVLVPAEDPRNLSAAIVRMLKDDDFRGKTSKAAFALFKQEYTIDKHCETLAGYYQQLVCNDFHLSMPKAAR